MMREPRTIVMSFLVPAALLLLFGFAVTFDIREIRMAVWDKDHSARSRELARAFVSSGYFKEVERITSRREAAGALDSGRSSLVLTLPRGFQRDVDNGVTAEVQILLDGTDSSRASVIQGHARKIIQSYTAAKLALRLGNLGIGDGGGLLPVDFRPIVFYNPELESRNFMAPGLIAVLLTILGVLQMSLAIAREKDLGTLEQLRVTPLRAWEILVGKMLPYALVAFANAWISLGLCHYLMDVPVRGSLVVFGAGTVLFLLSALGIGLTISALTKTQQGAQTAAFLGSVLPVFYLSDFMFPILNMPRALQAVTYLIPARYYVTILRGTLQKGVGFGELSFSFIALGVYAGVIGLIGVLAIRRAMR